MTHNEWLEERRKGIGGSDAAAIVGLNKYKSAFDVYADKLKLIPPKDDNEAMRQGRDLEEYVAQRFCEYTGKKVRRKNSMIHNEKYPFAFANVDRLVIGENAGLECKTANSLSIKRYKNGEFPEEYYCQCMHYMAVTGYEKWYLAVLIFGTEFKIFEIIRDEDDIEALMQAEHDFWHNNVLVQKPPVPTGTDSDNNVINALYPQSDDTTIQLVGFNEKLKRHCELKEYIDKLDKEKKQIEQEIKLYMGESVRAENDAYVIKWSDRQRNNIDMPRVINDYLKDKDLSGYIKTTKYRAFEIQEVK